MATAARSQKQLPLVSEISLPDRLHLRSLGGGFWAEGWSAGEIIQFKVSPDQSLLILCPSASGKWPLVRVREWWTSSPEIEKLDLPGWAQANARFETDFSTGLLISQNGKFAIALGSVGSVKDVHHIPFPPGESIEHKPDLLITVVDLEKWQIAGALHTATVDPAADFKGAHIVNGRWLALQGFDNEPETVKYEHLYDRVNRLISIPDLKPGPGCSTKSPETLALPLGYGRPPGGAVGLSESNDAACKELLADAGVASMRILDWFIYLDHDPEPKDLNAHLQMLQVAGLPESGRLWDSPSLNWPGGEYNPGYSTYNEWGVYEDNPPFEAATGNWYQLQGKDQGVNFHYQLNRYSNGGQLLKSRDTDLNAGPRCLRHACVCAVKDASDQLGKILVLCRAVSTNFVGGEDWHNQWVAVFRAGDLSWAGEAEIKTSYTRVALVAAEGRTYVAAVEEGKVVRIYSVPDR